MVQSARLEFWDDQELVQAFSDLRVRGLRETAILQQVVPEAILADADQIRASVVFSDESEAQFEIPRRLK